MSGPRYRPVDPRIYPRFAGVRTFMRLPHVADLDGLDAAAVGVPVRHGDELPGGRALRPGGDPLRVGLLRPYHPALAVDVLRG